MKTAELVAGHRTDALVALARELPLSSEFNQGEYILVGAGDGDLYQYSPSTTRAQWAELIEEFDVWLSDDGHSKIASLSPHMNDGIQSALTVGLAICKAVIAAKWGDEIPDAIWGKVK